MRQSRITALARWTALLGAVLALVVGAAMAISTLDRAAPRAPAAASGATPAGTSVDTEPARPGRPGRPVAVRLPSLHVLARVVPVGLEADGALVPPADPRVVGWWRGGARPGSNRGVAVLTGHTVHDGGGVFDDLAALERDDTAEVVTPARVLDFEVLSVRDLSRAELAARAERLFTPSGPPRLVLVTCSGWDGEGYEGNTVVVARVR